MSVSVRIPTILRTYTGGQAEVTADPGTLREVLAGLDATYPGLAGRIMDDTGNLRRFVNVYVGEEDVRFAQGLETPVPAGRARVGDPSGRRRLISGRHAARTQVLFSLFSLRVNCGAPVPARHQLGHVTALGE